MTAAATVLTLHPGDHVAVGEVGVEIGIGLQIPIAGKHIIGEPVPAVGTQLRQRLAALVLDPVAQLRAGPGVEGRQGDVHLPEQQVQVGEQRFDAAAATGLQAFTGGGDPLGLALGEAGGGEGDAAEEIRRLRTGLGPAAEQIHLLLHRQEAADLLEEHLELRAAEAGIQIPLQATAALHELFEQLQALTALLHGGQLPAEQIEHQKGRERVEIAHQALTQVRQLAHPLQQLQSLLQLAGGGLEVTAAAALLSGGAAGQAGEKAQVGLAAAAQGRCLGGLQGATGQLEGLLRLAGLQQQQQPGHLQGAGNIERRHGIRTAGQGGELGFVGPSSLAIAEQIGALVQQPGPGLQGLGGETLVGHPIQTLVQGAQHRLGIAGRADAEQSEMVDREVQPAAAHWRVTVGRGSDFDRLQGTDPVQSAARTP